MADSVKITLEIATAAAEKALNNLKTQTASVTSAFSVFQGTLAGGIALKAITGLASGISGAFHSIIDEASQGEVAVNKLNVALQQSGQYSANTSADLQAFADQLQNTTIYGDEAALASSSLLLSLTNLSTDGVKNATQASADLAATLNIDLQSATEMIAKAVNGNTTAFKKMGIEIQSGNTDSERLTNTLAALSSQQGAAAAQTNTYQGAMAKLENAQGDLLKAIGQMITQNPLVVAGIKLTIDAFSNLTTWITDNKQLFSDLGTTILYTSGIIAAGAIAVGIYAVASAGASAALGFLAVSATAAWAAVTGPVGLAVIAIVAVGAAVYGLIKYWDQVTEAIYNTVAATLEYAAKAASVISDSAAAKLNTEAQAWRDKANAIGVARQAAIDEAEAVKQAEADKAAAQDLANASALRKKEIEELRKVNAEKLAMEQSQSQQILLIEQDRLLQLEALELQHQTTLQTTRGEFGVVQLEAQLALQEEQLLARQEYETAVLEASIKTAQDKAKLEEDDVARKKKLDEVNNKAVIDRLKLQSKQELDVKKQQNKAEEELEANRIASRDSTLNTIATLQNSNNKVLATIGKAAAIASIAIDTPVAISKALASAPPPFNFALAGIVGVAMAAQAAQIAGLNFADGGIVPGTSYVGDKVAANVNSGEMVLNKGQQAKLFQIANRGSDFDNSVTNALLAEIATAMKAGHIIEIDGREIINVVREGLDSGRSFA